MELGFHSHLTLRKRESGITNMRNGRFDRAGQGQFDSESRAPADLRFEFYRTIVELYKSKSIGQSYSSTARPRGEKELENFIAILGTDSFSGVRNDDLRVVAILRELPGELPARSHRVAAVQQQIKNSLMD